MRTTSEESRETAARFVPLPANRTELEERHAEAWRRILAGLPASPCPAVEPTTAGPALKLGGRSIEGALDAGRAASALVDRARIADATEIVVFGFGSGHLPRATLRAADPDACVAVVVLDPGALAMTLAHLDVSDVLADPRLRILVGDLRTLAAAMPPGDADLGVVVSEPLLEAAAPALRPLADMARELGVVQRSLRTQFGDILDNVACNLETIVASPTVADLKSALEGRPVLLVAPGPSLDRQLDLLASRELPVVVALDTAIRPLLGAGVRPDLAVTLDPTRSNLAKFDGIEVDFPLVYFAGARPEVVAHARLPVFACEADGILERSHPWFGRGGTFRSRGSVLLAALDVLLDVGASPIALAGADLAHDRGRSHAGGAGRETGTASTRSVPGRHGGTVETSESLWRHWRRLNRRLDEVTPGRVLDATGEGAEILAPPVELGAWLESLTSEQLTRPTWAGAPAPDVHEANEARDAALRAIAEERASDRGCSGS